MTLQDVLGLINLLALGVLAWWIRSLKGAVDAQKETIAAQKQFLDAADIPQMQQRFESYKKTVDLEKEAAICALEIKSADDKNKFSQSAQRLLTEMNQQRLNLYDLLSGTMPFVPPEDRKKIVESIRLPSTLHDAVVLLAEKAPDLSRPEVRRGLVYAGHLVRIAKKTD